MTAVQAEHDVDRPLIEAIQQGDPGAMAEFVQRQQRWVRGLIFAATGRRDEVDDVAQRVWMQVWNEAGRLDDPARWRFWLYRIARNAAIDAGRRRRRRQRLLDRIVARTRRPPEHAEPPDRHLELRDRQWIILDAIASLPALYREPFTLRHVENWSYRQIGEVLGLPVETVETRLVRARRLLRERLADGI